MDINTTKKINKIISILDYKIYVEEIYRDKAVNPKTIIMINGMAATTRSYTWVIQELTEYNLILYDLPHLGNSKFYNDESGLITKEDESKILESLIKIYSPDYMFSMSWGGFSALLALSKQSFNINKSIVASFSIKKPDCMYDFIYYQQEVLERKNYEKFAEYFVNTVGFYLPERLKQRSFRYFTKMSLMEYNYLISHLKQVININTELYANKLKNINSEVCFMNGELDNYTSPEDAMELKKYVRNSKFVTVKNAGHFLAIENKYASSIISNQIKSFFK